MQMLTFLGEFKKRKRKILIEHQGSLHQKLTSHGLRHVVPDCPLSSVLRVVQDGLGGLGKKNEWPGTLTGPRS